ncbi:MAG: hypothetical protein OXF04_02750, partial [bacterium]|nr:hypothetical protein [bacterium]
QELPGRAIVVEDNLDGPGQGVAAPLHFVERPRRRTLYCGCRRVGEHRLQNGLTVKANKSARVPDYFSHQSGLACLARTGDHHGAKY